MTTVFRTIDGVPLSRDEWTYVMRAANAAFSAALGGNYGNHAEARLYAMEVGDLATVQMYDALEDTARGAEAAAMTAALAAITAADPT